MPIYEYQCRKCKEKVERIQKVNDPAPDCPRQSGSEADHEMVKLVSVGNFELRGGGWAKDGYSG